MRIKTTLMMLLIIIFCGNLFGQSNRKKNVMLGMAQLSDEFEQLSKRVSPAIVQIIATGWSSTPAGSINILRKERSSGSGVILDPNGFIVTNAHVIDGAKRVQVVLSISEKAPDGGRSILKPRGKIVGAQIVGIDRETDLAVLKIADNNLPYLELGNSDSVNKGQLVLAFGSPLGLENSVTMGVVSSLARQLRPEDPMIYIQTDATINPGNSGGPLIDTNGKVIGINTLIFSQSGGSEGIGFAAPSNIVKNVYKQLRQTGRVRRGIIGVHAQTITPLLAAGLGLQNAGNVILGDVSPYSPADKAGLMVGDVILSLDGKKMENGRQFDINLYSRAVGTEVILEIQRKTVRKMVKVTTVERTDDPERFSALVSPERNLVSRLGILALDLTERVRNMLPKLRISSGVVVADRASLPYGDDALLPGDVIHSINNQVITSLADIKGVLETLQLYDPVVVQVERRGELRYVAFELE